MIACTAIAAALLAAAPGATVATGPIHCPAPVIISKVNAAGVTLDATGAQFDEGMNIVGSHGITIRGGTFGTPARDTRARYAVFITDSRHISLNGAAVVAGPATISDAGWFLTGDRGGVQVRGGSHITIRRISVTGFRTGVKMSGATDSLIAFNGFAGAYSDGINVLDCQRVIIAGNSMHWLLRYGTSNSDGIQLWSIAGKPLQSDIWLLNNGMTGRMQGILSSDPKTGSGTRLHFHGNYAAVTQPHTITCGACTNSVATDNVLASYPGTAFGIGKLKGFDPALGNVAARNPMLDGTKALPPRTWWFGDVPLAGKVGSMFDDRSILPATLQVQP